MAPVSRAEEAGLPDFPAGGAQPARFVNAAQERNATAPALAVAPASAAVALAPIQAQAEVEPAVAAHRVERPGLPRLAAADKTRIPTGKREAAAQALLPANRLMSTNKPALACAPADAASWRPL